MERRITTQGFVSLYALAALAALALLLAVALNWAVEAKNEGRMLADMQRVISALDVGMEKAKASFPDPVKFMVQAEDVSVFSGEFNYDTTNQITNEVPTLIQYSWEQVKTLVLETAVTASAKVGKAGVVTRTKVSYNSVLLSQ